MTKKFLSGKDKIWKSITWIATKSYDVICKILYTIYHVLKLVLKLLQVFFFGISSFIAANALLILAISLSLYLLSAAIGLSESEAFQNRRDDLIRTHFEVLDEWITFKKAYSEAKQQGYKLAEVTDLSCNENSDCTPPNDYLIQSNCPYTSLCLQNRCAVVCPKEFRQ